MLPQRPDAAIRTDAADLGYGGTLNFQNFDAGVNGHFRSQGIWCWRDRAASISHRGLKAIRKFLCRNLGTKLAPSEKKNLLLFLYNQAVVYITNSFVSPIRPMMRELR